MTETDMGDALIGQLRVELSLALQGMDAAADKIATLQSQLATARKALEAAKGYMLNAPEADGPDAGHHRALPA